MYNYDISVLIPVYNSENYISTCIDSILAQTKDRIEIIVVDDGSTDSTPQILDNYAEHTDNVFVIHQENRGVANARKECIKHATGEYIGWVDADDFIEPEMFSTLFDLAKTNDADLVYCDYNFFPREVFTKSKWYKPYKGKKDWDFIDRNTQCWNKLMRKTLVDKVNLGDLLIEFEEYSHIAFMLESATIVSCDEKLYNYRVGHDSLSGGSYAGKVRQFRKGCAMSSKLYKIIEGTKYESDLKEYFKYRYIYTLIQLEIVAAINNDRANYKFAKRKLRALHFADNEYTKPILDNNHGKLKSFILRHGITRNYETARLIVKKVYG